MNKSSIIIDMDHDIRKAEIEDMKSIKRVSEELKRARKEKRKK